MKMKQRWFAVAMLCIAVVSLSFVFLLEPVDTVKLLSTARKNLRAGRFELAEQAAIRAVANDNKLVDAYLIAGEAAAKAGRIETAVSYYRKGAELERRAKPKADFYFYAGESCIQTGRLVEAESLYKAALKATPDHLLAEDRLEFIYRTESRVSESVAILERRAASNTASVEQLLNLGYPYGNRTFPPELIKFMTQLEADVIPMLTFAKESLAQGEVKIAEERLRRIVAKIPDQVDAQAELGKLLVDQDETAFVKWFEDLPPTIRESSRIWFVRGLWAERHSMWSEAASGFLNCVTIDPLNRSAMFQLAAALEHLGNHQDAEICRDRNRKLDRIERTLNDIYTNNRTRESVLTLIPLLNETGRLTESRNWLRHATMQFQDAPELQSMSATSAKDAPQSQRWSAMIERLSHIKDTQPIPRLLSKTVKEPKADPSEPVSSRISFQSASKDVGIEFEFVNLPPSKSRKKMVQSNGGGIGVIDLDADGWSDLYFTQGGTWPSTDASSGPSDKLFRNRFGQRFQDVSIESGVIDYDFGQGVTVGDLNGDGFDEIYVANVGANRLFRNNGDGTFSDITLESNVAGHDWSTSCAMNDLNLDGHLDLYVVNYLSLQDAAAEICHDGDKLISCRPEGNIAIDDVLFMNTGDSGFSDTSLASNIRQPNGRGLGIITADFDGDHAPDIFVGNDAVPNYLFLNRSRIDQATESATHSEPRGEEQDSALTADQKGAHPVVFEESAFQRGIATDGTGKSLASMGIAFADFNGDQFDDVFVTNFYNEPNTLYVGQMDGMFIERSRALQLAQPSFPMLGFGTQALDADLDGDSDLVVLNGHLDDLSEKGVPFEMKPQVFENHAGKWFIERNLDDRFFAEAHIGRPLTRVDWNNDGREDLVAGLLESPYEVLTNTSQSEKRWLSLQLVGTRCARNGIGAFVTVQNGTASLSKQLSSGSGFHASNQNRLSLTVPGETKGETVQITVRWADGTKTAWDNVSTNKNYIAVQPQHHTAESARLIPLVH